jgi:hypothetical protein
MLLQRLWFINRVYPERDKGYTCIRVRLQYKHYQGEKEEKIFAKVFKLNISSSKHIKGPVVVATGLHSISSP